MSATGSEARQTMLARIRSGVAPLVVTGLSLFVIGVFGIWANDAWLIPSLGAAILLQALLPSQQSARMWNTFAGQAAGLIGGLIAVFLTGSETAPPLLAGHPLEYRRVGAAAIAVLLTGFLQLPAEAVHPAGGAVALLVALGTEPPTWQGAGTVLAGIALVTMLGEGVRRSALWT